MVLKIKDFTWTQNDEFIYINIPLKGKQKNDVDIVTTDCYIKVNFKPYIFECFFWGTVDDLSSKTIFNNGLLMVQLRKSTNGQWEYLSSGEYDDKEMAKKKREIEIKKFEEKTLKIIESNATNKRDGEKYSLQQMMQLETDEKERLKQAKDEEVKKSLIEFEVWQERQRTVSLVAVADNRIFTPVAATECMINVKEINKVQPLRQSGKIEVSFTPRVFPTPERESVKEKEQEWLEKQQEIRRNQRQQVISSVDVPQQQTDPDWLKNKGNSLFAVGDYGAALEAYSMGLAINSNLHELYSNRAACHIKLRNFFKAIEDASKALDLLNPPVMQNLKSRIKAHLRRGAAFCNLEMYREGLMDYEAALKLEPANESVKQDVIRLKSLSGIKCQ